jgi:fermentation-respiration switch protein FrsA (DUF1100 family)
MNFSWQKFLRSFVLPITIGIVVGSVFIVMFEERMIYFPFKYPDGYWEPERFGLRVEDCYFTTTDNIRLHGWFISSQQARATLLLCHGNAGNISHRIDLAKKLLPLHINVFMFDYRGYGRSEGEPSEEGLYRDVAAAYDYLLTRHDVDSNRIIAFGQSLGSAVAVDLATKRQCKALLIEAAFTSAADVAQSLFWWLPIHPFIRSKFDSDAKIKSLHLPILFIHGENDRTIPLALGEKLFDAANEPKWFYNIPNADHNDTYIVGREEYFRKIDEFLISVLRYD